MKNQYEKKINIGVSQYSNNSNPNQIYNSVI